MLGKHWSSKEIAGRIAMEHSALDCELSGHRKATRLLRHHGKRRHSKGGQGRTGKLRITHDISERPEAAS